MEGVTFFSPKKKPVPATEDNRAQETSEPQQHAPLFLAARPAVFSRSGVNFRAKPPRAAPLSTSLSICPSATEAARTRSIDRVTSNNQLESYRRANTQKKKKIRSFSVELTTPY